MVYFLKQTLSRRCLSSLILIVCIVRGVGKGEFCLVILRGRQGRGGRGARRYGERGGGRDGGGGGVGGALPRPEPVPHVVEREHGEGGRGGEHAGVLRAGGVTERSPTLEAERILDLSVNILYE